MEAVLGSATKFALDNTLELIKKLRASASAAGSKVNKLAENLEILRGFVNRYTELAEEHYENDGILRAVADQTRNLIHQAEDAIEECIYYKESNSTFGVNSACQKIEGINKELDEKLIRNDLIVESALRLEQAANKPKDKRPKPALPEADKVIGFVDATKDVIHRLTGTEFDQSTSETHKAKLEAELKKVQAVSIYGMVGSGKTTLAKKVLNDPNIKFEFFTRIFVVVSDDYDKRDVLQKILVNGKFCKNDSELKDRSIPDLVELIGQNLTKKYLVILDDIWKTGVWDELKPVFPENGRGSRVLITTRNNNVAKYCTSKIKPYELRPLYPEESQELLRTKIFDENTCPMDLVDIEKDILKKCDRLPLAIVVTAGILRNDRENKEWWDKVLRGVSQSTFITDDQKKSEMLVKMSYDHLPYQLKPCFLYLGVFPEDADIPVWNLLRLWIAEGFIQQEVDGTLEEIAEEYLRELVDRNLVMVEDRSSNGKIKTCRVHDTLRKFCKDRAVKENLFREIKSLGEATGASTNFSLGDCRRLCVNTYVSDYIRSLNEAPHLRSFLSFAKEENVLNNDDMLRVMKPYKLLRVLDIKSTRLVGLRPPKELHTLVRLKHIALNCELKKLPNDMSCLYNLQTIVINTTSRTLDIKLDLWKMRQLRHLHTNASATLPKCHESSLMVNLQTLSTISPDSCIPEVLGKTPKIKKLGIRGKLATIVKPNGERKNLGILGILGPIVKHNSESTPFDTLLMLKDLENLKLLNNDVTCKLPDFPLEHNFPAKLKKLSLENTVLEWRYMSTLGKLKCLEVLKLKDHAFKGKEWKTEDGGFLCLKVLFIGATDLEDWEAQSSNLPKLRCLILKHCRYLKTIPSDLANIKSLRMIELEHVSSSVVLSAKNMELRDLEVLLQKGDLETSPLKVKVFPPQ